MAAVLAQDSRTAPVDPTTGGSVPLATPVIPGTTVTATTVTPPLIVCRVPQCEYPARGGHPFCSRTCADIFTTTTTPTMSQRSSSSTDGAALSTTQHQQVVDIITTSMTAAVIMNSVVADISKAYEPQLRHQAELIRTTRAVHLPSASVLHQAETDRSRVETDLLALQQQNVVSDLTRRQVHLTSHSIDEANDNGRLRGHARNPVRLTELKRQLVGKGLIMTREQLLRVADMMDDNDQVSPPPHAVTNTQHALPPAWVLGVGAESASFSSGMGPPSARLFSRIQAQGFAATDPVTTPFGLLPKTLAAAANGGKPPKAFTLSASYGEWVKKLREHGWSTPELHTTNPKYLLLGVGMGVTDGGVHQLRAQLGGGGRVLHPSDGGVEEQLAEPHHARCEGGVQVRPHPRGGEVSSTHRVPYGGGTEEDVQTEYLDALRQQVGDQGHQEQGEPHRHLVRSSPDVLPGGRRPPLGREDGGRAPAWWPRRRAEAERRRSERRRRW